MVVWNVEIVEIARAAKMLRFITQLGWKDLHTIEISGFKFQLYCCIFFFKCKFSLHTDICVILRAAATDIFVYKLELFTLMSNFKFWKFNGTHLNNTHWPTNLCGIAISPPSKGHRHSVCDCIVADSYHTQIPVADTLIPHWLKSVRNQIFLVVVGTTWWLHRCAVSL